jgi:hypothetical protein
MTKLMIAFRNFATAPKNLLLLKCFTLILEFLISNFRRVLYVLCFLLGNSPASEFYRGGSGYRTVSGG